MLENEYAAVVRAEENAASMEQWFLDQTCPAMSSGMRPSRHEWDQAHPRASRQIDEALGYLNAELADRLDIARRTFEEIAFLLNSKASTYASALISARAEEARVKRAKQDEGEGNNDDE